MWSEADSDTFLAAGAAFVPDREMQMEIVCDLLGNPRAVLELCCGEGLLSQAILARFPQCRVMAFDGSPRMLENARRRNPERFEARLFDLAASDWRSFPEPVDAIVSSLAIHHLDSDQKRSLYADLYRQLSGTLVIADLIEPASAASREVAAKQWDAAIAPEHRAEFERLQWNLYRYPDPQTDKPSGLLEQLTWLAEIGFTHVDVHYLRAGHAIFSGQK